MQTWSSPFEFVVDVMWRGVVIHACIYVAMQTVNLRFWEFWSGDDR